MLAPCAMGGLIDERIAGGLHCRVVCGAANNPLAGEGTAARLRRCGVLYVPDFLANCGGLIRADVERRGADADEFVERVALAEERTRDVLAEAQGTGQLPVVVAEARARRRVNLAHSHAPTSLE